jgi:SpoIIAA-like
MDVRYDKTLDVLIVEISGTLSAKIYDEAIEAIFNSPSFRPNINVIYDLSNAKASLLSTGEIRAVAERAKKLGPSRGTSWKAALVVPGMLEYGLARMFEFLNDGAIFKVRAFRSIEEAKEWMVEKSSLPDSSISSDHSKGESQ